MPTVSGSGDMYAEQPFSISMSTPHSRRHCKALSPVSCPIFFSTAAIHPPPHCPNISLPKSSLRCVSFSHNQSNPPLHLQLAPVRGDDPPSRSIHCCALAPFSFFSSVNGCASSPVPPPRLSVVHRSCDRTTTVPPQAEATTPARAHRDCRL